jgi:2-keto-4-pentenoate hydratase/2-oxohepta-3-ene-1,7-dioic acid hydratase in catechol pathway
MKILCIGRNYVEHIQELNNEKPDAPVVFSKPDTALLKDGAPFYYPAFSQDIHHECEIVVKICKEGKSIEEKFANKYFDEIGLGIDFTARDLQTKLKTKGLPWDLAKGFNGSAPISHFVPVSNFPNVQDINFKLLVNGEVKQQGNTQFMMYSIPFIISFISQYITLKKGDLIFTGTPKGVGPVQIGDRLEGFIEGEKMLDFEVK